MKSEGRIKQARKGEFGFEASGFVVATGAL